MKLFRTTKNRRNCEMLSVLFKL